MVKIAGGSVCVPVLVNTINLGAETDLQTLFFVFRIHLLCSRIHHLPPHVAIRPPKLLDRLSPPSTKMFLLHYDKPT